MVLEMSFLSFSNVDVKFAELKNSPRDTLSTTSQVELIDKREFAKTAIDENSGTFSMHMSVLDVAESLIYHFWAAQIAALWWERVFTKIPAKYSDYADVFFSEQAMELPKNTGINKHAIELIDEKQPSYGLIYALTLVELETLKTYVKTHLKTGFIWPSKFSTRAPIFFDKKSDSSFRLCINYWGLNNLTIKNQYPKSWIGEALDCLGQAK